MSISSTGGQFEVIICVRERVFLGTSREGSYSGTSISSSMVIERKSRIGGDKSASYVVPDDATTDIDVFWTRFKTLDLVACPIFRVVC